MTDAAIKPGDVVHDLVKRGKMQVVAKAAPSVAEYRNQEGFDLAGYKSHPLLDVDEDEEVFTCVYLPDEPTTSFSGTYDFPRSRLARIPVEKANEDVDRLQDDLIVTVLSTLVDQAMQANAAANVDADDHLDAIRTCWPDKRTDLLEAAVEIAQARRVTVGEDGDGDD